MSRRGRVSPPPGKCLPRVVCMQGRRIARSLGSRRCSRPIPSIVTRMDIRTSPNPRLPLPLRRPRRRQGGGGTTPPPPPPPSGGDGDDEDDEGMLRMSFLGHLEELRTRIIRALMGVAVAFVLSLTYCSQLWDFVCQPAVAALKTLGYKEQNLVQIEPMEAFNIIWFKLPVLCAIFLAAPWILYQVWAFIAPGLYKRERR